MPVVSANTVVLMQGNLLGGGVIFVVAALLWAAVLVPSWMQRRQLRAAERNAIRLQRTIHALAESSEMPEEMRVVANAREALAHERLLRSAQKKQEAERKAELADARAQQVRAEIIAAQRERRQRAIQKAAKLRRPVVRRVRALGAVAALLGILGTLVGAGLALAGAGAALLLWSVATFAAAFATLVLLAPGRIRVQVPQAEQDLVSAIPERREQAVSQQRVAQPDPLAQAAAAHAAAQRAAAAERRIAKQRALARQQRPAPRVNQPDSMLLTEARELARAEAAREVRETITQAEEAVRSGAREAREVRERAAERKQVNARQVRQEAVSVQDEVAARLAAMGVVGDTSEGRLDLGEVLQRRRRA